MPDFGFSYTEAGFLMTVFFTISGVGQALAGIVVDRYGARRVLMAGVSMLAASGLALAAAANYRDAGAGGRLAGLGNSVFHPADFSLLNKKVSPARLGYAFSVHGLSGNLGWALGRGDFGYGPGLGRLARCRIGRGAGGGGHRNGAAVCPALLIDDDKPKVGAGGTASTNVFGFMGLPAIWLAFLFFFLITSAFSGLQNFSVPVLGGIYGISATAAVAALTGYLLGAAAGMVAGGFIAVRVHAHDRTVGAALVGAAVFAIALATGLPPAWGVVPLMVASALVSASPARRATCWCVASPLNRSPVARSRPPSAASMALSIRGSTSAWRWVHWCSASCSMPAGAMACCRVSRCFKSSPW
jgi:FSR family fosmidomycin resistance protein-like MFS transporter